MRLFCRVPNSAILRSALILPTRHFQFKFQSSKETSMMSLTVRWQSARFRCAHSPVARARPFGREALRAPAH